MQIENKVNTEIDKNIDENDGINNGSDIIINYDKTDNKITSEL